MEYKRLVARLLNKAATAMKPYRAKVMGVNLDDFKAGNIIDKHSEHWISLKSLMLEGTSHLLKWWTGVRFNGFSKNKRPCTCAEAPTLTLSHILSCERFTSAIDKACLIENITRSDYLELLTSHRFIGWTEFRLSNLKALKGLEETISQEISRVLDPAAVITEKRHNHHMSGNIPDRLDLIESDLALE